MAEGEGPTEFDALEAREGPPPEWTWDLVFRRRGDAVPETRDGRAFWLVFASVVVLVFLVQSAWPVLLGVALLVLVVGFRLVSSRPARLGSVGVGEPLTAAVHCDRNGFAVDGARHAWKEIRLVAAAREGLTLDVEAGRRFYVEAGAFRNRGKFAAFSERVQAWIGHADEGPSFASYR